MYSAAASAALRVLSSSSLKRSHQFLNAERAFVPTVYNARMPAEWEPHSQCWMGWPELTANWRSSAAPAQDAFVAVATAISEFEPVTVCASNGAWCTARAALPHNIRVVEMNCNDAWFRDVGPTFIEASLTPNGPRQLLGVSWSFNAYGNKFASDLDVLVAAKICSTQATPCVRSGLVTEGGALHTDGEGTVLATEQAILNPNRNPGLTRQQVEAELRRCLGARKVIWIKNGLYADHDTDGHIDNLACFARPGLVLLAWTEDVKDPQYAVSEAALRTLESSTDAAGRPLQVVKLPHPPPLYRTAAEVSGLDWWGRSFRAVGERLAASYVNFYMPSGGIVMPALGVPEADERARAVLQDVFPDRKVVCVETREVLLGGGNIHCITQQQPALAHEPAAGPRANTCDRQSDDGSRAFQLPEMQRH